MAFVSQPQNHDDETNRPSYFDMHRNQLAILLDNPIIFLKGTGVDVEPAVLSGRVGLYLAESCSIKEITLQFSGKARCANYDSGTGNSSSVTYVVCSHEWSFLEGEKKHSHTLKAGRHFFPFQLRLGGSLPSSISTEAMGGASVVYKLKAHAARPGIGHNLQATAPVSIIRSLTAEALEYQQTLEIENTWPEKLMYSIMVPHKAWAAGDTLTAVMKFCPLSKGVCVLSVATSIHESTKVFGRLGREQTRLVASVKHDIYEGKAIEVIERRRTPGNSGSNTPATSGSHRSASGSYFSLTPNNPSNPDSPSTDIPRGTPQDSDIRPGPGSRDDDSEDGDISTMITIEIPLAITPTHSVDPIIVSHRIRWNILILNLDGHTSELRCSLPLCILDHRLLEEARSFSAQTRRLLIGGPEVPPTPAERDRELPSYNAHLRDRVANMWLSDAAIMRVPNPWVQASVSPVVVGDDAVSPWHDVHSGTSTPLEEYTLSQLPHAPGVGTNTPLQWLNSELLISSVSTHESPTSHPSTTPSPEQSEHSSRSNSRLGSRRTSRNASRNASPERGHGGSGHETYVHHASHASRNIQSIFKASLKPLSSLSHPFRHSRPYSHLHSHVPTLSQSTPHHPPSPGSQFRDLLHRAFTEVPDYEIASRGFIGGVTPLSSMNGLPSYDEASRVGTPTDELADRLSTTPPLVSSNS